MSRFIRREKPGYWSSWERLWLTELRTWAKATTPQRIPSAKDRAWKWQREGRTLAQRFRDEVWTADAPRLCAYCDGPLEETSPTTIDHLPDVRVVGRSTKPKISIFDANVPCCLVLPSRPRPALLG